MVLLQKLLMKLLQHLQDYSGASVAINGTTITASGSKSIFIDKVNDTVVGVTA